MRRPFSSSSALIGATVIVVLSLAALVIAPITMSSRVDRMRETLTVHADPARRSLNEIGFRLSEQMAMLTRAVATRDQRYVGRYRGAIEPQMRALEALETHRGQLGPQYDERLDELRGRISLWHRSVEQSVRLDSLMFDANYPETIRAVRKLDQAITLYQADRRRSVERLAGRQVRVTLLLVFTAMAAAAIVLWMVQRLRSLAAALKTESAARQQALEAQRKLAENREQILSVVSHDLRSPLTTVALTTDLLRDADSEERDEHLETIRVTTRRMNRLIEDLLDITRIDHGGFTIREELVDVTAVANEVTVSHRTIAEAKEIRLVEEIEPALPRLVGDGDRLAQALGNLLGNAIKFTPAGGEVRFAVSSRNGSVRFEVSDTGAGIDPEDLPHLFEPFWQADGTSHMGAGLGLKITRAIVDAHGGTIEVSNNDDGGATFSFEVPTGG